MLENIVTELNFPYKLFIDGEYEGWHTTLEIHKEQDKSWIGCGSNGTFLEYHPHDIKFKINSHRGNEVYLWVDKEYWE